MYKVKITLSPNDEGIIRQLPQSKTTLGEYEFIINQDIAEADFWVVCFQRLTQKEERCRVAPQNTLFITWEPDSVYHYAQGFLDQFGKVVSCQEHLKHRNLSKDQPGLGWHIGKIWYPDKPTEFTQTFDTLKNSSSFKKTKLLSVICSNKAFTKGHRKRIAFVQALKEHYKDDLDLYGNGFQYFKDKWDVIAPYKYHIVLENCSIPDYWSEKLADAYLGNAFPFYYGCTNINKYFDKDAYKSIDIDNIPEAINIIDNAIANNTFEQSEKILSQSKDLILEKYNLFPHIIKHIQDMDANAPKETVVIKDDLSFLDIPKIPLITKRIFNKIKYNYFK